MSRSLTGKPEVICSRSAATTTGGPRIAIRVDGDSGHEAGMGHVYRSLAYADLLSERVADVEIRFVMRRLIEGVSKVIAAGYKVIELPVCPAAADYEHALSDYRPHLVIVDTLGSSSAVISVCRKLGCKVVSVDDLGGEASEADIVVNGIVWATRWLPESHGTARVYQGIEYVQLRQQFAVANKQQRSLSPVVREIVVSTGGADGRGFLSQLMGAVHQISFPCKANVLVGPACANSEAVEQAVQALREPIEFALVYNTPDVSSFMMSADLALISGGTIMFEAAACGTPAVVVCTYEHQSPQAQWFHERGIAVNLGFFPYSLDQELVRRAIEEVAADLPHRGDMSVIGKRTVDGRGVFRFVDIVDSYSRTNLL